MVLIWCFLQLLGVSEVYCAAQVLVRVRSMNTLPPSKLSNPKPAALMSAQ